jgi:hypothetical protein
MKTLSLLIVAAFLVAVPSSCKSSQTATLPCVCGTPEGDLEGCEHPLCRDGKTNPDNPKCVCGTLEIPTSGKKK